MCLRLKSMKLVKENELVLIAIIEIRKWDPDKHCYVDSAIPGWREQVEPMMQDTMFWNSIWISLGCPYSGSLFELKKLVRNKDHYAVRKCPAQAVATRLEKLLEAAQSGDADLLKQMKTIKGSKKQQSAVTENVDGANGCEAISEKFKAVFEAPYNSTESIDEINVSKETLNNLIGLDSMVQVNRVTGREVKEACTRMTPGKADVTGSFTSDVLLNGPDALFECLAGVFR